MRWVMWVLVLLLAVAGCDGPRPQDEGSRVYPDPNRDYSRRLPDAPFPAHTGSVFVVVDGKLLLFGGHEYIDCEGMMSCPIGNEITSMVVYDPRHQKWTRLPDLPRALGSQPEVTTLGDRLIATAGGHFRVFDLSTKRWREYAAPTIDPASASHLVAHGRAVFALTGVSDPKSPVQRLDLRSGSWSVLTRKGLGSATTRSIFWTEAGLVSAGYDSSSGTPVQAVARYAHGKWHRYAEPPRPVSPAPYVSWDGLIVISAPPGGGAQGLNPNSGEWIRVPGSLDRVALRPDGRPERPTGDRDVVQPDFGVTQYELSGHSQLWEQPLNLG